MTLTDDIERQALALLDLAFDQPTDDRQAFVKGHKNFNRAVKSRALQLLAEENGADIATGGALVDASEGHIPPPTVGPWQIGALIGRGGMGAVYQAERIGGGFEQTVAIKFVGVGNINVQLADRLREERRLLAGLNHPNITQLIDGGETDDGIPYLVTERVEGQTLQARVEGKKLRLNEKLDVFAAILSGMAYAHQNGVVHRDLSPSNVLVRNDGVVKIIDFGIAKSMDDSDEASTRQSVTQGFTAPERLDGRLSTTLSDVFSLGAILEWMTADEKPPRFEDLAAIVAKAKADTPTDRYSSVDLLRIDIDRYRERRSVHAQSRGLGYRFRRFAGRHPLSLGSAGMAALAGAVAFIAISILYIRAERAEAEALARFDSLRELSRSVLFDVYDAIERIPLTEDAQILVTELGRQYLEELESDPRSTTQLSGDIAAGYIQLGHILADSNKDFFFSPDVASEYWAQAEERLDTILAAEPDNVDALVTKAQLIRWRTQSDLFARADRDAALDAYQQADRLMSTALDKDPLNREAILVHAAIQSAKADALEINGRADEAREIAEGAVNMLLSLPQSHRKTRGVQMAIANQRRMLGRILVGQGAYGEAIDTLTSSLADLDQAEALTAPDRMTRRARSIAHWRRAFARNQGGDPEGAVTDYQEAIAITERRLAIDPENKDATYHLVAWSGEMSLPLSALGRFDEAEAALRTSGAWYQQRYEAEPDDPRRVRTMLVHNAQMTELFRAAGRHDARCAATRELIRYTDEMTALDALSPQDAAAIAPYRTELETCVF